MPTQPLEFVVMMRWQRGDDPTARSASFHLNDEDARAFERTYQPYVPVGREAVVVDPFVRDVLIALNSEGFCGLSEINFLHARTIAEGKRPSKLWRTMIHSMCTDMLMLDNLPEVGDDE